MIRAPHSALARLFAVVACLAVAPYAYAQTHAPQPTEVAHEAPTRANPTQSPNAAVATQGLDTSLEQTFRQADDEFQAANYGQAALTFTRVWQLAQSPEHRDRWGRYVAIFAFNAATSHRLNHDCDAAYMAFSHYIAAFSALSIDQQHTLRQATDLPADNGIWLQELREECPNSPPTAASAQTGGTDNPTPPAATETALQPSGNWLLDVNLPRKTKVPAPEDTSETPTSRWGWFLTAGGVASLAVSGYFVWSGLSNNDNATDPANKHERYIDYEARRDRDYAVAGVIGALGIGLTGVGIYVLSTSIDANEHQTRRTPTLWLFATGTQLGLGGLL